MWSWQILTVQTFSSFSCTNKALVKATYKTNLCLQYWSAYIKLNLITQYFELP